MIYDQEFNEEDEIPEFKERDSELEGESDENEGWEWDEEEIE